VRAHRFLSGEDGLALAWAGHGPAKAASSTGVARALPTEHGRRDGSGIALSQQIDVIGPALSWPAAEDGGSAAPE
jgi:DNA gyrase subunit A